MKALQKNIIQKKQTATDGKAFFQPKLAINQPDDVYEPEADAMADHVMRMSDATANNKSFFTPSISSIQRKCAHCEEEDKKMQRKEDGNGSPDASAHVEDYVNSLSGNGNPMNEDEKSFFESRMGYDFSGVRLHTDSAAAKSAQSINALAYTTGNNIVFNHEQYAPDTDSGKRLLGHELTHVVQQSDAASYQSPGLAIRRKLRNAIQRAPVNTNWGTFKDESYVTLNNAAGKAIGAEMYLKFQPGNNVDAKLIGMVQSVRSVINGAAIAINNDPTIKSRMITSKDARPNNSSVLGTDEGIQIDQLSNFRNPLYAVGSVPAADTTLSQGTTTNPVTTLPHAGPQGQLYRGWGIHGYRYKDGVNWKSKDAELHDTPTLGNRGNNAEQLFETTALAIDGTQNGTYYGSVEWGWRTDAKGNFSTIPLGLKSMGIPSSSFLKAASIWNTGKSSTGESNIALPLPGFQIYVVTNAAGANMRDNTGANVLLPAGTRVKVLRTLALSVGVEVIDGPMIGRQGTVDASDLGEERNTAAHPPLPPVGDFPPLNMPEGTAIA
jgi:hypothetical protein